MDERVSLFGDARRLLPLRKPDLPNLALAIVAYQRQQAQVWHGLTREVAWVRLFSNDGRLNVYVRGDDWAKILPYLEDGRWNPAIVAVPKTVYLHPSRALDIPSLPINDQALYVRVLMDLEREFPTDFPTSNL